MLVGRPASVLAGYATGLIQMPTGMFATRRLGTGSGRGFTLVELLVVVVIIAVLGAITVPVVVKAKETAKVSECLANMREIGAGLHMYLDEYDLRFPSAVPWGAPNYWKQPKLGKFKTIQELLTPYVSAGLVTEKGDRGDVYTHPGVFACPSDTGIPSGSVASEQDSILGVPVNEPVWKHSGCSYEYYAANQQDWLSAATDPPSIPWTGISPEVTVGGQAIRIGAPTNAVYWLSRKAVLGEVYFWHMGDRVPDGSIAYRNTLYADGHAARVRGVSHLEARLEELKHWHRYHETD